STGVIAWTPTTTGVVPVTVQVRDGHGGQASQSFTITVAAQTFVNHSPQFILEPPPPTDAAAEATYVYRATAFDPDYDPLTFDLPVHPDGMSVDPVHGTVVWKPTDAQANQSFWVLLRAQDNRGGVDLQWYQISVAP